MIFIKIYALGFLITLTLMVATIHVGQCIKPEDFQPDGIHCPDGRVVPRRAFFWSVMTLSVLWPFTLPAMLWGAVRAVICRQGKGGPDA